MQISSCLSSDLKTNRQAFIPVKFYCGSVCAWGLYAKHARRTTDWLTVVAEEHCTNIQNYKCILGSKVYLTEAHKLNTRTHHNVMKFSSQVLNSPGELSGLLYLNKSFTTDIRQMSSGTDHRSIWQAHQHVATSCFPSIGMQAGISFIMWSKDDMLLGFSSIDLLSGKMSVFLFIHVSTRIKLIFKMANRRESSWWDKGMRRTNWLLG